jgi:putative ABC transport system substrate-binding protein
MKFHRSQRRSYPSGWTGTLRRAVQFALVAAVVVTMGMPAHSISAPSRHYTIAVATLMTQPALDAVQSEMIRELTREGFVDGKNVTYILKNANGQATLAPIIANDLASRDPDVLVAITTPMAEAMLKASSNTHIPLVFAAVTDPVGAHLVQSVDRGQPRVTGTSDAWPYEAQLKLIREISPSAKRIGVLFNPGETASQYGIQKIRTFAPRFGFTLIEAPVSSTSDVYPTAQGLTGRVDVLFLSSDNTVISGMAGALKVSVANRLPLYVGDSGTVEKGGMAAVSVGYTQLGADTGRLIARVLHGERSIPTVVEQGADIYINTAAAARMGVTIPPSVLKRATHVYSTIE